MSRNPLRALIERPGVYRLVLKQGRLTEASEGVLRWATSGRIGVLDLVGLPNLRVIVPGRNTGLFRIITLQCVLDGDRLIVVGSNWARRVHPAWSDNLIAAREVTILRRGERFQASVRLLTAADRAQAWEKVLASWPNYALAQDLSEGREFRLFELTRKSGSIMWPAGTG